MSLRSLLTALESKNPDSKSLLKLISDLISMINTAKFDYSVLKNLMSENALLVQERDELQLKQISQNVAHMSLRLNSIKREYEILQTKLNQPVLPKPLNVCSRKNIYRDLQIPEYDEADFTVNLQVRR